MKSSERNPFNGWRCISVVRNIVRITSLENDPFAIVRSSNKTKKCKTTRTVIKISEREVRLVNRGDSSDSSDS